LGISALIGVVVIAKDYPFAANGLEPMLEPVGGVK
jgi:hypothetical protein